MFSSHNAAVHAVLCDVGNKVKEIKHNRVLALSYPCQPDAMTDDEAHITGKPTAEERKRFSYFVVTELPTKCLLCVRWTDNEAFFSALVTILKQSVRTFLVWPKFVNHAKARKLKEIVAPMQGLQGKLFDSKIDYRWSNELWLKYDQSLNLLLRAISQHEYQKKRMAQQARPLSDVEEAAERALERSRTAFYDEYMHATDMYLTWTNSVLDQFRTQLFPRLTVLVIQLCYFDILLQASSVHAKAYLRRFIRALDWCGMNTDDIFDRLVAIDTVEKMACDPYCSALRLKSNGRGGWISTPSKHAILVSQPCLSYLRHTIFMRLHVRIATLIRTHIQFKVQK